MSNFGAITDEVFRRGFDIACSDGDTAEMREYLDHGVSNVDAPDARGETFLFSAVASGDTQAVQLLLDLDVVIDRVNRSGETPLSKALQAQDEKMGRFLLEAGASIHPQDQPAIMRVAGETSTACLDLLLEYGADVNVQNRVGQSALNRAASKGKLENINWLLDHGADIEIRDNSGNTALKSAALHGRTEAARLLLERGANRDTRDNRGLSSLDIALIFGQYETALELYRKGVDTTITQGASDYFHSYATSDVDTTPWTTDYAEFTRPFYNFFHATQHAATAKELITAWQNLPTDSIRDQFKNLGPYLQRIHANEVKAPHRRRLPGRRPS